MKLHAEERVAAVPLIGADTWYTVDHWVNCFSLVCCMTCRGATMHVRGRELARAGHTLFQRYGLHPAIGGGP